jgi:radical SAM enzyme (TIGR01210 family)
MINNPDLEITDRWILSKRGKKNLVDSRKPYAWLVEKERAAGGTIADTAVIFLTNRECPFHCLMCDLWKNTTDMPVPHGAVPDQIEWALNQMPETRHLKLYNSGSFFDKLAIPEEDYEKIASLVSKFETVIVESHPGLINEKALVLRDLLKPELQIAIGLETVHPGVLRKLNKHMTKSDFKKAVNFLKKNGIPTRAFILLKPPFMSETEGIYWAERSLDFAFSAGVECCTIIPVRGGNGAMETLMETGNYAPPSIRSLEKVLEYGISLKKGRVFADAWDLHQFSTCENCLDQRTSRLIEMNLNQEITNPVTCVCSDNL